MNMLKAKKEGETRRGGGTDYLAIQQNADNAMKRDKTGVLLSQIE